MLDYIWFDDKKTIVEQLPAGFTSAAILLHPFVQMPAGWEQSVRKHPWQHIYPSDETILKLGKPFSWQKMMGHSGLRSYKEVVVALTTAIHALRGKWQRKDLADQLKANFPADLYYPTEDTTSVFLLEGLLKVLGSKGAQSIYFSDPICEHSGPCEHSGYLPLSAAVPLDICDLSGHELIVTDEQMDYAFMSVYDSFFTLFLAKEANIQSLVRKMGWEAIICDQETCINWFLK